MLSRTTKEEFFKFVESLDAKVVNQKIILDENSLILKFDTSADLEDIKKRIDRFLDTHHDIHIQRVYKLIRKKNELIVKFKSGEKKIKL